MTTVTLYVKDVVTAIEKCKTENSYYFSGDISRLSTITVACKFSATDTIQLDMNDFILIQNHLETSK